MNNEGMSFDEMEDAAYKEMEAEVLGLAPEATVEKKKPLSLLNQEKRLREVEADNDSLRAEMADLTSIVGELKADNAELHRRFAASDLQKIRRDLQRIHQALFRAGPSFNYQEE